MSVLDALLLISPSAVCASDEAAGRRAARLATDAIETRLRRRLVVQPHAQYGGNSPGGAWWTRGVTGAVCFDWARQWPVVFLTSDRPTASAPLSAAPTEAEGALYAVEVPDLSSHDRWHRGWPDGLGDETGERLGLTIVPDDGRAVYLAGYRRDDQLGETGRAEINAAIEAAHPTWGPEAVAAEAWTRTPLLPAAIASAADELARGFLTTQAAGLGAVRQRRQEREESAQSLTLDTGWQEALLAPLDHLAWVDA